MIRTSFPCPSCEKPGLRFSFWSSLSHVAKKQCPSCGAAIVSDPGSWRNLVLAVAGQVAVLIFGIPLIYGILGEFWWVVVLSVALLCAAIWPLALVLHSGRVKLAREKKYRFYDGP